MSAILRMFAIYLIIKCICLENDIQDGCLSILDGHFSTGELFSSHSKQQRARFVNFLFDKNIAMRSGINHDYIQK